MNNIDQSKSTFDGSPFHQGEQEIQVRLNVRDKMERFGKQVIRDFMPAQHRDFFNQLPFLFVGHADKDAWPWASILYGEAGFITSKNAKQLEVSAAVIQGDPLAEFLQLSDSSHRRLGLLGIELPSRRRNRLSGHITRASDKHIELEVDQAFGNCPQHIQTRELEYIDLANQPASSVKNMTQFDTQAISLISNSDTFFVASYVANGSGEASEGVDVSHRGGRPGFIRVDDEHTLTIPDYLGNFHFNTLGNFLVNPKAGLLFIDFENGHLLTVSGTVEILWDSPDTHHFNGAERLWRFRIDHGRWIKHAIPLRWKLGEYSPNSQLTGTWQEAEQIKEAEKNKNQWCSHDVVNIVDESSVIKSFYLKPQSGMSPIFKAGQFLTVRVNIDNKQVIRTYTVSNAPSDEHIRISVKREATDNDSIPHGLFSNYLHDHISVGDVIDAKAPTGAFTFDASEERPAVLISAGVGMTPMVSMARHTLMEGMRTRSIRSVTLISAARNQAQRAFFNELNELSNSSDGYIRSFWVLSETEKQMTPGKDFHHKGRISKEFLQAILPVDDYDFYLCEPPSFMQSVYGMLRRLGVNDARIYAEAFGSASITRDENLLEARSAANTFEKLPVANEAMIEFSDSNVEQAWSKGDGTLLEFAESHGLTPQYGCRNGQCGSCKTKLVSGKVTYQQEYTTFVADDEVLLCCAVPAETDGDDVEKISIKL